MESLSLQFHYREKSSKNKEGLFFKKKGEVNTPHKK